MSILTQVEHRCRDHLLSCSCERRKLDSVESPRVCVTHGSSLGFHLAVCLCPPYGAQDHVITYVRAKWNTDESSVQIPAFPDIKYSLISTYDESPTHRILIKPCCSMFKMETKGRRNIH